MSTTPLQRSGPAETQTAAGDGMLLTIDPAESTVEVEVKTLLPEFEQVEVQASDGSSYAITRATGGVRWDSLRVGQRLSCRVKIDRNPRVVYASLLA